MTQTNTGLGKEELQSPPRGNERALFLTAFLLFLLAFLALVPLKAFNLYGLLLHNPVSGPTQESENFTRLFLWIIPALSLLSFILAQLLKRALTSTPSNRLRITIWILAGINILITGTLLADDRLNLGALLLISIAASLFLSLLAGLKRLLSILVKG